MIRVADKRQALRLCLLVVVQRKRNDHRGAIRRRGRNLRPVRRELAAVDVAPMHFLVRPNARQVRMCGHGGGWQDEARHLSRKKRNMQQCAQSKLVCDRRRSPRHRAPETGQLQQSGRSVNLRTPSCHGKKARCGDAIVRVVSRSISAENLPNKKWTSKLSSRVEGHDRSLAELFFFFFYRRNRAFKPDEQCQSNGRKLFLRSTRRNGKANASFIENRRKHSSFQSQRGKTLKKRVWK